MIRIILILFFCFGVLHSANAQKKNGNDKPGVVLFLSPDCPICQKYMVKLSEFFSDFSSEIEFQGIVPGNSKKKDIKEFIKAYDIRFSLKLDKGNHFVTKYKPNVTPEVVLLDTAGNIKYQGAIDNWFYELGKYRHQPTEHYLLNAIQAVLEGKDPEVQRTEAIGCIIQADLKGGETGVNTTHPHH